jgi:hypothetical protein
VAIRDLRRVLLYRNLMVRQATRMKNRIAGLLIETGTASSKNGCMANRTSASW